MTFAPRIVYGDIDLTDAPYSVEFGFDLGNATNIYDVMVSLMRDGTLSVSNGTNNRVLTIPVIVEQPDSGALSSWAADIEVEAGKPSSTLTFSPGDGHGADTVLTTFTADIAHDWDQDLEQSGLRRYLLTIPALPFGRSADEVTINWTGPGVEVDLDVARWSVISGGGTVENYSPGGDYTVGSVGIRKAASTGLQVVEGISDVPLDDYLTFYCETGAGAGTLYIDGVLQDDSKVRLESWSLASPRYTYDVSAHRGTTPTLRFSLVTGSGGAGLSALWTAGYPNPNFDTSTAFGRPRGIGVIDVVGSARAPLALISFTAPTGGAWLYTAPDPNVALRERGAVENLSTKWTVVTDPVYAAGDYVRVTSRSDPQPPRLNPDGIWPQLYTYADQFAYPSARGTAVSFFTAGAVSVISASPDLPTGFHSAAILHEEHVLHPGRCGFAVVAAATGLPVATTVTFYPHWWAHAGQ